MTPSKTELGIVARIVGRNVANRRAELGLNYAELSRALTRVGHDIPTLGLRFIEKAQRRVDVDDLVALAIVLEVSPATLLMPSVHEDDLVQLPGDIETSGKGLWNWLTASYPLRGSTMAFYSDALPRWERDDIESRLGVVR